MAVLCSTTNAQSSFLRRSNGVRNLAVDQSEDITTAEDTQKGMQLDIPGGKIPNCLSCWLPLRFFCHPHLTFNCPPLPLSIVGVHVNVGGNGVNVDTPWSSTHTHDDGTTTVDTPWSHSHADENGNTVVDTPWSHSNTDEHGNTTIETPWSETQVNGGGDDSDDNQHHPDAIGSTTCDNVGKYKVNDEPSCDNALTGFYDAVAAFGKATDQGRVASMDQFCKTQCGHVYTASLFAERLGCGEQEEESSNHRDDDHDDDDDDEDTEPFRMDQKKKPNNKATASRREPSYPTEYPGLHLGCIKDKKDNKYCALKKAAVDDEPYACDFYKSCCYAEYAALVAEIPDDFVDEVEKKCPGSREFLKGNLCSA